MHDDMKAMVFSFEPFRPRPDSDIEQNIFVAKFQELMGDPVQTIFYEEGHLEREDFAAGIPAFDAITRWMRRYPRPRDAQIAASTVQWLGTNVGNSILMKMQKAAGKLSGMYSASQAYQMVWADETATDRLVPHLYKDVILATDYINGALAPDKNPHVVPEHTADDDMMMHVMFGWLGSEAGQQYVAHCEETIAIQDAAYRATPVRPLRRGFIPDLGQPKTALPALRR